MNFAISSKSVEIESIVCDTKFTNERTLMNNDNIIKEIISIEPLNTKKNTSDDITLMASNWVPNSGYAKAWPSQNIKDATYLEVSYRWDSESDLSTLTGGPDSTLEPDLVFYNYDGNAMCTDWYDGNYACNTNQPRAYMDTSAFDNSDEPVFTIGCSSAEELEAETDYYWIAYGN